MKFTICLHYSHIVLFYSFLYGAFAASQTSLSDPSNYNKGAGLKRGSQKPRNENLIMMGRTLDINCLDINKPDGHFSNVSLVQDKKRLKRTVNKPTSEMPPFFLLALEEVKKPGCKEKREISNKVIPLCLYSMGNTLRKRSLINDTIVDKVIEKYFPKIKEPPHEKFNYKHHQVRKSPKLRRNTRLSKKDYSLSPEQTNIDKLNVITEANRTLDHISKLTECDFVEMPEAMKKPLVAVLLKRISNIYSDKNKIKKQ